MASIDHLTEVLKGVQQSRPWRAGHGKTATAWVNEADALMQVPVFKEKDNNFTVLFLERTVKFSWVQLPGGFPRAKCAISNFRKALPVYQSEC